MRTEQVKLEIKRRNEKLRQLKEEADDVIYVDNFEDVPLTGIDRRIAIESLCFKDYYSFNQEGKNKLIILIHI